MDLIKVIIESESDVRDVDDINKLIKQGNARIIAIDYVVYSQTEQDNRFNFITKEMGS